MKKMNEMYPVILHPVKIVLKCDLCQQLGDFPLGNSGVGRGAGETNRKTNTRKQEKIYISIHKPMALKEILTSTKNLFTGSYDARPNE